MKKRILSLLCSVAMLASVSVCAADDSAGDVDVADAAAKVAAFPGAEGGGMWTTGARGAFESGESIEVYHVTSLADSGEGSFRDAVSKGNRIVVFDVSGYIDLSSNVTIGHDNMTILGQTAPGDGITFRGNNIKVGANNVILRYLRFRVGSKLADGSDTRAQDGLEVTDNCQNIIIDHCSVSWGTDENLAAYAVKDVTIQRSIIAEALNQSVHDKGEHGYAAIWGGVNLSVHHNIIATHKSRNPKIGTSETVSMTAGYTDDKTLVDIRNNIFYNWSDKAGYGAENGAEVNIINNWYKPGPATGYDVRTDASGSQSVTFRADKRSRIFELSPGNKYQANWSGKVYANGNVIDDDSTDPTAVSYAEAVNADNWQPEKGTGIYLGKGGITYVKLTSPNETYINDYPITTTTAQEAYNDVLANAGANFPKSDKVDERILENVQNRTAPSGSKGSVGLVDDPTDGVPDGVEAEYDDRGYPIFSNEIRPADYDTDGDGIADSWEDKMGLNKENPYDSTYIGAGGYTYLEIFSEEGISHEADDISLAVNGSEATVKSPSGEPVDLYVDGKFVQTVEFGGAGAPEGAALITAGYDESGKLIDESHSIHSGGAAVFPTLSKAADVIKHFIWESLDSIKPADAGGAGGEATVTLPTDTSGVYTVNAKGKQSGNYSNADYLCVPRESDETHTQSGDFNFIVKLDLIPSNVKNAYGYIALTNGAVSCKLGAGTDANYSKVIYLDEETLPLDGAVYLRAQRSGDTLTLYSGETLRSWTKLKDYSVSEAATSITVGDYKPNESDKFATNVSTDLITEISAPQISIVNVADNSRLGFNEDLEINVQPDGAEIREIDVLLGEDEIVSQKVSINETQTITIPLSFSTVANGVLKVVCVDANLCTAEDARNVVISADPTPWLVADIGGTGGGLPSYVEVAETEQYKNETYKINSIDGSIGGTSDTFSYLYQKFTGDHILYYRSRLQGSKQFGIVLKSDLDADGATYFFGGDTTQGAVAYALKARSTKGGEMSVVSDVTGTTGGSQNLYFAAEKKGNTLNIYQTAAGATVYTEKTLLASVDVSALGDEYYMGFGAVNSSDNPPDVGWMELDGISGDESVSYKWDFDNGIDWYWQHQEKKVLESVWSEEEIGGNTSGKALLEPDENYSGERYLFREYLIPQNETLVLSGSFDIVLSGEEPAFNAYFKTKAGGKSFKVSFTEDGNITAGDNVIGTYEKSKWYTVGISSDMGRDSSSCSITVTETGGKSVASAENVAASDMREQKNIVKKTDIIGGMFFEPVFGADGRYYIDNVSVIGTPSSVRIEKETNWYTFKDVEALSGAFTVNGTTLPDGGELTGTQMNVASNAGSLATKGYDVAGVRFAKRIRLNKNKAGALTVPVKNGATVYVYCASANSTSERSLFINGKEYKVLSGTMLEYDYTGEDGNIEIYATDGIDLYGVCVEKVTYTQV